MPQPVATWVTKVFFQGFAGGGLSGAAAVSGGAALTYAATYAATTFALIEASKALAEQDQPRRGPRTQDVIVRGGEAPQVEIYGQAYASGLLTYANSRKQNNAEEYDWYMVLTHAGHECESFGNMYYDDDILIDGTNFDWTGGNMQSGKWYAASSGAIPSVILRRELGTTTQTVNTILNTDFPTDWPSTARGRGYAYSFHQFVRFPDSEEMFAGGPPRNVRVEIEGRNDVFDPRPSPQVNAFTKNPVLLAAHYMVDVMGIPSAKMDWDFIGTEATVCDTTVIVAPDESPQNTQARYEFGGLISHGIDHETNLNTILTSCLGKYAKVSGKWRIYAGAYRTPTVTITEDWIVGTVTASTARPRSERFNRCTGIYYAGEQGDVRMEFPPVEDASLVTRDNGEEITQHIDLPGCRNQYQAQRIAYKLLQQTNRQITATVPLNWRGMDITPGTYVTLTYSKYGWSSKVFECVDWTFNPPGSGKPPVEVVLLEDDSTWWDDPAVGEYSTRAPIGGEIEAATTEVSPPTSVTAFSEVNQHRVVVTQPVDLGQYDTTRIYASATNAWAGATLAGSFSMQDGGEVTFEHTPGTERFYWVRNVIAGKESDREPDSDTSTISAEALAEGIVSSLFESLYAHFLMDSASFIPDLTGDNDAATIGGNPSVAPNTGPGGVGSAIRFDENTEHVIVMDDATADGFDPRAGSSAWSMSLWFNSDEATTGNAEARVINRDPSDFWGLVVDQSLAHGAQTIEFRCNDSSDDTTITVGDNTLFGDQHWHHVVITVTAAGLVSMYVDDAFVDDSGADVYAPVAEVSPQQDRPVVSGVDTEAAPGTSQPFNGRVYDVRFFTKVLSLSEIHSLYTYPYSAGVTPPVGLDSANLQYNSRFQIEDTAHDGRPAGTWMAGGSGQNLIRSYMDNGQKVMSVGGINSDNTHDVTLSPFPLNDAKQYRVRVTARHLGAENSPQASTVTLSMAEYDSDLLENELGINTGATPIPANGWDDAKTVSADRRTVISSAAPDWEGREWPSTWTTEEAVYIPTAGAQYAAFRIDQNDGNDTTGGRFLVAMVEVFEEAIDTDAIVTEGATAIDSTTVAQVSITNGSGASSPRTDTPWIDVVTSSSITPHEDGSPMIIHFDGRYEGKLIGASTIEANIRIVDIAASPWEVIYADPTDSAHFALLDEVRTVQFQIFDNRAGTDARQYRVQARPYHNGNLGAQLEDITFNIWEMKR